jgi:hypothetical protein
MRWAAGVGVMLLATGAAAEALSSFEGSWRATEATPSIGELPPPARDLLFELRPETDGFRLRWRVPEGGIEETSFRPASRPGVFAPPTESPGLLGRFFPPDRGDPLRGQRLVWARLGDDGLVLYALAVDGSGDFALDRRALRPSNGGLLVEMQRRDASGEILHLETVLERSGR